MVCFCSFKEKLKLKSVTAHSVLSQRGGGREGEEEEEGERSDTYVGRMDTWE